jgi:hypothetical protein
VHSRSIASHTRKNIKFVYTHTAMKKKRIEMSESTKVVNQNENCLFKVFPYRVERREREKNS